MLHQTVKDKYIYIICNHFCHLCASMYVRFVFPCNFRSFPAGFFIFDNQMNVICKKTYLELMESLLMLASHQCVMDLKQSMHSNNTYEPMYLHSLMFYGVRVVGEFPYFSMVKSYNHRCHTKILYGTSGWKVIQPLVPYKKFIWDQWYSDSHIKFLYGTSGCMTFQPLVPYKIFVWHRWLYDFTIEKYGNSRTIRTP